MALLLAYGSHEKSDEDPLRWDGSTHWASRIPEWRTADGHGTADTEGAGFEEGDQGV